jgi:iron complex outermembrane receptor protein
MAAFYYDYRNQQFINVDPTTAAQTLLNIPKSRIYGAEAELTVRPTDTFTFHGGLGLLSTKIIRGDVSGTDVPGRRLSNAPSLTFNAGIDFTVFKNDALTFSIHPDLSYQSNQFFEVINVPACASRPMRWWAGMWIWRRRTGAIRCRSGPRIWATSSTSRRGWTCWRASASTTTTSATRARSA